MPDIKVPRTIPAGPYWNLTELFLSTLSVSPFMLTVLDDPDAATARATLGANNAANLTTGTLPNARVSATLTADKAFRRGNILGTVSESGGVPTGALIERGSNANGEYVRLADGTQTCWIFGAGLTFSSTSILSASLTFPATFASTNYTASHETTAFTVANTAARGNMWFPTSRATTGLTARLVAAGTFTAGDTATLNLVISGRWF